MTKSQMIKISGFVQGVGYRYWAEQTAISLELKGWVCNLKDGSVQCYLVGEDYNVDSFIERARKGPFRARVSKIDNLPLSHGEQEEPTSFQIVSSPW